MQRGGSVIVNLGTDRHRREVLLLRRKSRDSAREALCCKFLLGMIGAISVWRMSLWNWCGSAFIDMDGYWLYNSLNNLLHFNSLVPLSLSYLTLSSNSPAISSPTSPATNLLFLQPSPLNFPTGPNTIEVTGHPFQINNST